MIDLQKVRLTKNLIRPAGHLLPEGEGFPVLFEIWILQFQASPVCRITSEDNEKFTNVS